MLALFVLGLGATWWLVRTVPSAFVPEEDEGYFITVIQAPAGASLGYTTEIAKQAEAILFKEGDIRAAFSVVGFSFAGAAPNNGLIFTRLKDYDERPGKDHSLQAVLARIRGPLMGITGGLVIPFAPPGIQGLSVFGGFQYQLLDQTGGDISRLAETIGSLIGAASQQRRGGGPVLELPRERPAAGGRHRPRPGPQPGPAAARGDRRARRCSWARRT